MVRDSPLVKFLNLRGDLSEDAPVRKKFVRVLTYYARLVRYTAGAQTKLFHILWNNRFEVFDRTLLMLFYRIFGKRIVLTAHNVNTRKRDRTDTWFNRLTLRIQYRLCSHILVHTKAMKEEIMSDFRLPSDRVTVIPFGLNETTPTTALSREDARARLGLKQEKTMLFFGQIAPYKGLEYLIRALALLAAEGEDFRLLIAGRIKPGCEMYWKTIEAEIAAAGLTSQIAQHVRFIPDSEVEVFFKATDVVVIPYAQIFQSGVPFLSYSFGVPVIAAKVGSLSEDIVEGETGLLCQSQDPADLARSILRFFASEPYQQLEQRRAKIRSFAAERNSWTKVGAILKTVYEGVLADRA